MLRKTWLFFFAVCGGLQATAAAASSESPATPVVSIIIDDIGDRWDDGRRAVDLVYPVSVSFLPHTPYAEVLAQRAHQQNKEVLLHLPMQAENGKALGPGGLTEGMSRDQFELIVQQNLSVVPHVAGVNNHMGSLLTQQLQPMQWLMETLQTKQGLFFVDSRTTRHSVAGTAASQHGVSTATRDIFLDPQQDANIIHAQFDRLLNTTQRKRPMLAIAHPYPLTLEILERRLAELQQAGVRLVSVATLIDLRQRRTTPWQTSLSP